jgi:hypothetical protein
MSSMIWNRRMCRLLRKKFQHTRSLLIKDLSQICHNDHRGKTNVFKCNFLDCWILKCYEDANISALTTDKNLTNFHHTWTILQDENCWVFLCNDAKQPCYIWLIDMCSIYQIFAWDFCKLVPTTLGIRHKHFIIQDSMNVGSIF